MTDLRDQRPGTGSARTGADAAREASAGIVLDNHRVVRDGSVWACLHCKRTWPFPQPLPEPVEPCVPRRWGDR